MVEDNEKQNFCNRISNYQFEDKMILFCNGNLESEVSIMSVTDLKKVYGMFTSAWKLFKEYADIWQMESEKWEQLVNESDKIAQSYGNCRLARDLLSAAVGELERRSKEVQNP
nr:hypothetical protein [uncultured Acetatifactor sp.]